MSPLDDLRDLPQAIYESIRNEVIYWFGFIREAWYLVLPLLIALFTLLWFAKPSPPKVVEMAAGRPSDYSFQLAKRYVDYFARNGIELRLVPTQGALDNLERLQNPSDSIKVAIIQGGLVNDPEEAKGLLSLGSIAYEPVWLFYWGSEADDLKRPLFQLLEGPISIGNPGSGTHVKALQMLKINGLSPNSKTMLELPEDQAIEALMKHQIKAMLLVENYESPLVQYLLKVNGLVVADFVRAKAYAKLLGYIEVLNVPMGSFDLIQNYPDHDLQLLSTTTTLVVEKDLHPAIQMLFMQASAAIVGHEQFFGETHEFPSVKDPTIRLSDVAHRYFEKGAPILSYYFPFWLAEFLERMGLLLVPFLAFAYPILKSIPGFLLKRAKKRIERFYVVLRRLESDVGMDCNLSMLEEQIAALEKLESEVLTIKINKKLVPDYYALRSDIKFVREVLMRFRKTELIRNDLQEHGD